MATSPTGSFLPTGKQYIPKFPLEKIIPDSLRKRMTDGEQKDAIKAIRQWEMDLAKALEKR